MNILEEFEAELRKLLAKFEGLTHKDADAVIGKVATDLHAGAVTAQADASAKVVAASTTVGAAIAAAPSTVAAAAPVPTALPDPIPAPAATK